MASTAESLNHRLTPREQSSKAGTSNTELRVPISEQLACAKRELALRRSAYPKWVASGRWRQDQADKELARMEAIIATLEKLKHLEEVSNEITGRTTKEATLL